MFFCASVVSTWALSPAVCAAVKSPRRLELTFRSTSVCRGRAAVDRDDADLRLPVLVGPEHDRHGALCRARMLHVEPSRRSAPAVGRVGERAEQQRHVVVLGGLLDGEGQHHLGIEGLPPLLGEPRRRSRTPAGGCRRAVASSVSRQRPSAVGDPLGQQVARRRTAGRRSPRPAARPPRPARASTTLTTRAPSPAAPVICASCSVASARSASRVVGQPAAQLGQHLLRRPAGGPDQEDVAEALLVGAVALDQGRARRRRRRRSSSSAPGGRPAASADEPSGAVADPRMRGQRDRDLVPRQRRGRPPRRGRPALSASGYGPAGERPRRRSAGRRCRRAAPRRPGRPARR